jgi:hypothetical protein
MAASEIVSRGAGKSQFAFAILLRYCGGFDANRFALQVRVAARFRAALAVSQQY